MRNKYMIKKQLVYGTIFILSFVILQNEISHADQYKAEDSLEMKHSQNIPKPCRTTDWSKRGSIIERTEPWEKTYIQNFTSTAEPLDNGRWRIWYGAGLPMTIAFAEGIPGKYMEKFQAVLSEYEPKDAPLSIGNLPDGWRPTQPVHIKLLDGCDRLYFWAHCPAQKIVRYLAADSTDGKRYKVLNTNSPCLYHIYDHAVTSPQENHEIPEELICNDATTVYQLPDGSFELYTATVFPIEKDDPRWAYNDNCPGLIRVIDRMVSEDGLHWTGRQRVLEPDKNAPNDLQFYYLAVTHTPKGRIGMLGHYRVKDQTMDIEWCFSTNGVNWVRPFRKAWLERSWPQNQIDSFGIYSPASLVKHDDKWWLFYTGYNYSHNGKIVHGKEKQTQIMLAVTDSIWAKDNINNPPVSITNVKTLTEKETIIERLLSEDWMSPEGLIYLVVMFNTNKRLSRDDILKWAPDPSTLKKHDLKHGNLIVDAVITNGIPCYLLEGVPYEDVYAYEDSLRSTSIYLSALCFKYKTTSNLAVLSQARKVFNTLYSVYEMGAKEQRGWIPKPYGGKTSKESSMDNQCPYYMSLIRYYKIATKTDQKKIRKVLTDQADYWIRNNYHMHLPYFGMDVDYATNKYYPGHWQLMFLPLLQGVWKITGDDKYQVEFERLVSQLEIEKGANPEYLRKQIRLYHRLYLQYDWLLELDAPHRSLWLKGLGYQEKVMAPNSIYHSLAIARWVDDKQTAKTKIKWLKDYMLKISLKDFTLKSNNPDLPKILGWWNDTLSTIGPAIWYERYWQGRYLGYWK